MDKYVNWTLEMLKTELRKRGAKISGRKHELVERLEAYDRNFNFKDPSQMDVETDSYSMQLPDLKLYRDINQSTKPKTIDMPSRKKNPKVAGLRFAPQNLTNEEISIRVYRVRPVPAAAPPPPIQLSTRLQGILDDVIRMIRLPVDAPECYAPNGIRPERGVLLFGPPGTGKTLLARAVRDECNRTALRMAFFAVDAAELLQGNVSTNLKDLFRAAKAVAPSVLFMDEIDSLFRHRGSNSAGVLTLLTLLDGIDSGDEDRIFVLAATNDRDSVEGALLRPGRLDLAIHLPLPTPAERVEYLQLFTQTWNVAAISLNAVADKAASYSPSELAALCRAAGLSALKRQNVTMRGHPRTWVLPFVAGITLMPADITAAFAIIKASRRK